MKNIFKSSVMVLLLLVIKLTASADEGMWLPQLLQSLNEKEMKKMGMKINASDIYSINKNSLKDAIVSLGGFCTAEVISDKGLLLTNHHCGFDAIQNHSTLQNNYIKDGFWSKKTQEELTNPGLTATFIISIEDVTEVIKQNLRNGMSEKDRQSVIDKTIAEIRGTKLKKSYQDILIRPFFEGNKFYLFITETYKDVRLVGAPPSSIGNFGKDTDNWMWPRHTGDFSLFRIYAGKDNKPAAYSKDNVPYTPKRSLNISLDGVKEGDFTMVFGFPGRTFEYLHSSAVRQIMYILDPAKIAIRKKTLNILNDAMRKDEQIKIQYASKYAGIENAYKKWMGEVQGLKAKDVINKKKIYEAEFQRRVLANSGWNAKYGTLLMDLENAYKGNDSFALARDYYNEIISKIELFTAANQLNTLVTAYENNGEQEYLKKKEEVKISIAGFYNEYNAPVDQRIFEVLMEMYIKDQNVKYISSAAKNILAQNENDYKKFSTAIYSNSIFSDPTRINKLFNLPSQEAINAIKNDQALQLLSELKKSYAGSVTSVLTGQQASITALQRLYMEAQMEVFPEKKFYPDANSTLRVTYGNAKGYVPRDGVKYNYYTYLDGVLEKYKPGDYEFDVPQKLIELYKKKDFGRYGVNGKLPVCFIGSNHTTGGNSGSPALDANGNLVGLNFDRVWEGTMSDISYDPDICRNIMVDIRYVVFIIDKFA
ncbi:MAG: S46 family peptidase, partial [Chitinophagaceae bacterium]